MNPPPYKKKRKEKREKYNKIGSGGVTPLVAKTILKLWSLPQEHF
jgi:hypothetical protein